MEPSAFHGIPLASPDGASTLNPKRWEEALRKDRRIEVNLSADYRSFTGLDRIINDEPLVRSYFLKFSSKSKTTNLSSLSFGTIISNRSLPRPSSPPAQATPKNGTPCSQPAPSTACANGSTSTFRTTTRNSSGPTNPSGSSSRSRTSETLLVKAFEINTFNHYTRNLRPVDTTINLDGLSALERIVKYKESPMLRSERSLTFGTEKAGRLRDRVHRERKEQPGPRHQGESQNPGKSRAGRARLRIVDGNNAKASQGNRMARGNGIFSKQGRNHPYPVQQPPGQKGSRSAGRFLLRSSPSLIISPRATSWTPPFTSTGKAWSRDDGQGDPSPPSSP